MHVAVFLSPFHDFFFLILNFAPDDDPNLFDSKPEVHDEISSLGLGNLKRSMYVPCAISYVVVFTIVVRFNLLLHTLLSVYSRSLLTAASLDLILLFFSESVRLQ